MNKNKKKQTSGKMRRHKRKSSEWDSIVQQVDMGNENKNKM